MPIAHGTTCVPIWEQIGSDAADMSLFPIASAPLQVVRAQVWPLLIQICKRQVRQQHLNDTANPGAAKAQGKNMPYIWFEKWCRVWAIMHQMLYQGRSSNPREFHSHSAKPCRTVSTYLFRSTKVCTSQAIGAATFRLTTFFTPLHRSVEWPVKVCNFLKIWGVPPSLPKSPLCRSHHLELCQQRHIEVICYMTWPHGQ